MTHRNNSATVRVEDRPFKVVYPTQQEIDALVREARLMRAQAMGRLLRGLWRWLTRSKAAAPSSLPAKA